MSNAPSHAAPTCRITMNGATTDTAATTLAELLAERGYADKKVATALNGQFVPAQARATQALHDGDAVEVVSARQGG